MARKVAVVNELYDLCYRHLAAAGIDLRPLGVAPPPRQDVDRRQRVLSSVELFRALPQDEIEALSRRLSRHEYESDQVAVSAGAVTDYLLIVESGVISLVVAGASGSSESMHLGPGDSIGEAGVLAGLPLDAQVTAVTKAVLYRLDKTDLTPLLKSRPEIGQQMCRLLSQRREALRSLNVVAPATADGEHTVFDWLREGMRKLHELTT
ncbi:cyclic nucleotide-binding domain-containing protein [Paraburkholderia sediminicola]